MSDQDSVKPWVDYPRWSDCERFRHALEAIETTPCNCTPRLSDGAHELCCQTQSDAVEIAREALGPKP